MQPDCPLTGRPPSPASLPQATDFSTEFTYEGHLHSKRNLQLATKSSMQELGTGSCKGIPVFCSKVRSGSMRVKLGLVLAILLVALSAHAQLTIPGTDDSAVAPVTPRGDPHSPRGISDVASISGTATAIDGTPLRDCRIELHDARRGTTIAQTTTGLSGTFDFRNLPPGTYEVVAISGINQAHEEVDVAHAQTLVDLRLNVQSADTPATATVSISELKIPEKARKEWAKGQQAFLKNKLQDARKHADRALEIAPQYAQALTLRGILELGDDQTEVGIADLQQAVKADPNYAMGFIALGAGLNAQQKFDEAQRTLQRGLSIDPHVWQGWFELTKSELARGEFKDALKNITRAQELNKDYPAIHLLMAHAFLGNHHYSRAVEEFELYLSQEPNSPNANNARAGLSQARSYMQAAEK